MFPSKITGGDGGVPKAEPVHLQRGPVWRHAGALGCASFGLPVRSKLGKSRGFLFIFFPMDHISDAML